MIVVDWLLAHQLILSFILCKSHSNRKSNSSILYHNPLLTLALPPMPGTHHCVYRGCTKAKASCKKHYWTCTGLDIEHQAISVFQKMACEQHVLRGDKIEACGKSKLRLRLATSYNLNGTELILKKMEMMTLRKKNKVKDQEYSIVRACLHYFLFMYLFSSVPSAYFLFSHLLKLNINQASCDVTSNNDNVMFYVTRDIKLPMGDRQHRSCFCIKSLFHD